MQFGLIPKDLFRLQGSRPWNPLIARSPAGAASSRSRAEGSSGCSFGGRLVEAVRAYLDPWRVEAAFRAMRDVPGLGPVGHWVE